MLVILTGPTGSGKTSVVLTAAHLFGWNVIRTLTTRPERPGHTDTKATISHHLMDDCLASPSTFRFFHYEQHIYATPIAAVIQAARCTTPVSVIDWVHPHPEDLSFLGENVVAVVLVPSAGELNKRLRTAGRLPRLALALAERDHILLHRDQYTSPWLLIESDAAALKVTETIERLVPRR
jgi:guanylate kinase